MSPVLRGFVLAYATPNRPFLVAYGELAIGMALVSGIPGAHGELSRADLHASTAVPVELPRPQRPFWHYFGASLSHLVLALCFALFVFGNADHAASLRPYLLGYRGRRSEF